MTEIPDNIKKLVEQYKKQAVPWVVDLNILIARAANSYVAQYNKQHEETDLTHPCISVLYFILENGGKITQRKLAKRLPVTKQSITAALKILENKGLIIRQTHSSDSRVKQIYLTGKAADFIEFSLPLRKYFSERIVEVIDENAGQCLITKLGKLNKFYEKDLSRHKKIK